jgi:hypothetical protein
VIFAQPKPVRSVDEDFLEFVRSQACVGCGGAAPNDPDHLSTRGARGSDRTCVPLCRSCHTERHSYGIREFERRHGVNLWQVNSQLLDRFHSDPIVILEKAAEFLEGANDIGPDHAALLWRILNALARRSAPLNGDAAELPGGGAPDERGELSPIR